MGHTKDWAGGVKSKFLHDELAGFKNPKPPSGSKEAERRVRGRVRGEVGGRTEKDGENPRDLRESDIEIRDLKESR